MAEGDIDLGAYLDSATATVPQPDLPEFTPKKLTYYFPATPEETRAKGLSYGMEGGIHGGPGFGELDLRNHTLEKFKAGESPFVAVAMHGRPTGDLFKMMVEGTPIIAKNVDTGGGLIPGQTDIATSNPALAKGGGYGGASVQAVPQAPAPETAQAPIPIKPIEFPTAEPEKKQRRATTIASGSAPIPQITVNVPQLQPFELPQAQPLPTGVGEPVQLSDFSKAVQEAALNPQPESLMASTQDIDLGAYLASQSATPAPTPTQTPTQDVDLGAYLAEQTSRSEVLPTPIGGQGEPDLVTKAVRAGGKYVGQMVPQSLEQAVQMTGVPTSLDPRAIAEFVSPPTRAAMGLGEQAYNRMQQIREADKTPALSQERFDAGLGTSLDLLMNMGMLGGIKAGMRPRAGAKPRATTVEPPVAWGTPEGLAYLKEQRALQEYEGTPGAEAPGWEGLRQGVREGKVPRPTSDAAYSRPAPQLSEPLQFSVDMPTDTFATEFTPVSSAIIDMGGVMSKSTAQRTGRYEGNAEQWDNAQPLSHPTHNKIYPSAKVSVANKPKLPRDLSGAKPRYGYGSKQFQLNFENDIDRAAYITAQKTRSKADARYLKFVMDATGLTESQVRAYGAEVRARIKEQARTSNEEVLNIAGNLAPEGRSVKSIGSGGEMPDVAAQTLYEAGLISDPSPDAMWAAVAQESKASRGSLKAQRSEAKAVGEGAKQKFTQDKAFNAAEQAAWKGGEPAIPVKDLQVGDTVTVGGEQFKVTDIDPDTFDVTLEDGRKFGVQTVSDQTVIYGEHESVTSPKYAAVSSGTANQIRKAVDSYDFDEQHVGHSQLADDLEAIDNLPKPLAKALEDYRNAVEEDRTLYGERSGEPEIYGDRLYKAATEHAAPETPTEAPPPPATTPPPAPPTQPQLPLPPEPPRTPPTLNPVADRGPFRRTYRVDKELGEMMDAIGASPEHGALVSELRGRNMLHELTPQQESNLGRLLVSERMKGVNPDHPMILSAEESRAIAENPAIKKALDYYRKEIEPEVEELHIRAGTKEEAVKKQRGSYITLIPERLPDGSIPQFVRRASEMSRTTKFARPAEGMAERYSTNIRDILRETYTESIRKAATRDLYNAVEAKGVAEPSPYFVHDPEGGPNAGKWVRAVKWKDLPPSIKHDLDLIARRGSNVAPEGFQKFLQAYQRGATSVQLGANPIEVQSHMRRGLHVLAAKPPIGYGLLARMEWLAPYFGPKLGTLKRMFSEFTPEREQIAKDLTAVGAGSSRGFSSRYVIKKVPGLKQVSEFTHELLWGTPKGKGVKGWEYRMRTVLEQIRRNVEPAYANDKQRMRQNGNQMGQYGTMQSWPIRALLNVNPYAATTLPMRAAELRTLFADPNFKGESLPKATLHRVETFMRGTGGTIIALSLGNKLLSGNWPWENGKGHEFDLKTGVQDKDGNDIYVPNRFISPEFFRAISTLSIPSLVKEARGTENPDYVSASSIGPMNAAASLVNSPALGISLAAVPQWALFAQRRPGEHGLDIMKIGRLSRDDKARGVPPLLKRAEGVADQIHPALSAILGYMDEPIKGLKPLGIYSVDKPRSEGGNVSQFFK